VCCAHEYTLSNLRFARAVEPANENLAHYQRDCQHLRARGEPTLPSTIALEREINPFLRTRLPAVVSAAARFKGAPADDEAGVLAAIREWKNEFR